MKNVVNVTMVLTGTFIGAGFASGREIWQYFGIFGDFGIFGIALSCLLLSFFTYCTACNIKDLGEEDYVKQLCYFKWVNWLLNGYMLLVFGTMITAFGECLNQTFGFPKFFGVVLMDLVTMVILYFGTEGLVRLSAVITPLIVLGIVFAYLSNNIMEVFSYNNFVTSSVVYTSYNHRYPSSRFSGIPSRNLASSSSWRLMILNAARIAADTHEPLFFGSYNGHPMQRPRPVHRSNTSTVSRSFSSFMLLPPSPADHPSPACFSLSTDSRRYSSKTNGHAARCRPRASTGDSAAPRCPRRNAPGYPSPSCAPGT